ncbi:tRNA pseudouridine(38-40) synthase TruA [Bacillus spongiae]|uniref:tRNA pseudouridine synthase A n=1 Tax=Bacillus spongiae TaxID=2683610 RepID=A0ABU8HIV6_9BACI
MQRVKCIVSYDGTLFSGYQVQPSKRTVQLELEKALKQIHKGTDVRITASGRTDAGVHALGQVFHFDTPLTIAENRWTIALNSLLNKEIVVLHSEFVPQDFHARYSVQKKEYRYKLNISPFPSPFTRNYAYHFPFPLNVAEMQKAADLLTGTFDFSSFCSAKTEVNDKVRSIYKISIKKTEDEVCFSFVGNGFLYNMVRIMTGTLIEVGQGKRRADDMVRLLALKDRQVTGKTAPAHGLYLWKVWYTNDN